MQINRKAFISLIVIISCVVVLMFIFSLHRSFSSSNSDESPAYDTDEIKSHPYETDGMDISAEDTKKMIYQLIQQKRKPVQHMRKMN